MILISQHLQHSCLASLSKWIDYNIENVRRDQEARTWGRLAKISEECGEVIGAFIGMTGQKSSERVIPTPRTTFLKNCSTLLSRLCVPTNI